MYSDGTFKTTLKQSYVRISVHNWRGEFTTISMTPKEYGVLASLARGSLRTTEAARVSEVCRQAARELSTAEFFGTFSAAVRKRASAKLRGSYSNERALQVEQVAFPEGVAVAV